ncbi:MAG: MFS transporter [Dongiaceae bacterium]
MPGKASIISPAKRNRAEKQKLPGYTAPVVALVAVNFFMADVRDGLGPYLAAFLQVHGWSTADIGMMLTFGGIIGMLATSPAGALVDAIHAKRSLMVAASLLVSASCLLLLWRTDYIIVGLSQIAMPLAGAVIPPAIAGISLGMVGQAGFDRQLGRNEAANHGGNVFGAALSGGGTWLFGIIGVLFVQIAMAVAAITATLSISPGAIDHARARGQRSDGQKAMGFGALLRNPPLVMFAFTMACFHLGNAAMLPMVGLRLGAEGGGSVGVWLSAAIIIAQLTMIPMAILTARIAAKSGYRNIVIAALLVLPVRGAIAAALPPLWSIIPVQILDGIGAGLLGVATPGFVARILHGSGRFNAGLGGVMTLQGVGAALSPTIGGWIAQEMGYPMAFGVLGAIAVVAIPIFLLIRTAAYGQADVAPAAAADLAPGRGP